MCHLHSATNIDLLFQIRTVNTITQSPLRTVRKSTSKAPITVNIQPHATSSPQVQPLPTPPATQQPAVPTSLTQSLSTPVRNPVGPHPADPGPVATSPPDSQNEPQSRALQKLPGTTGKRLNDYVGLSRKIIKKALFHYEASVIALSLCPDSDFQALWIQSAWSWNMSIMLPLDELPFELSEEIERLVSPKSYAYLILLIVYSQMTRRETCIRCSSWDRLRPLIEATYPFKTGSSLQCEKYNKERHLTLTADFGFYYLVWFFRNIFSIQLIWYTNRGSRTL